MLGGRENQNAGSYNREDCGRWANHYRIPFHYPPPEVFARRAARWVTSAFDREELPARAYHAADMSKRDALDEALSAAGWVEGLDVNEPDTILWAARRADMDGALLLAAAAEERSGQDARAALREFDARACPGVPTVMVGDERFFGKDRFDWVEAACDRLRIE